ncbi:hypothetical protein B7P43_G01779 [Cryptotermes secundus]|uniref:Uncharacterized protein n=1 Tax=Cryptotermes secundus TaxID=105785 RepID=A0A2J7Q015_9NEOP|nr:hypothetical protein B7P43_G01779 [Cryptotermes secundus]
MACKTLLETLPPDALVFFSDETHFHLSGCVKKQNMRCWSGNNPRELHERPLHSDKVTVWCALSRVGVIGPYFFEEDNHAVTVNSQRYVDMIKNFFEPALEEMHLGNVWFQQDGTTAHTARASMTVLRAKFPGRLISLRVNGINCYQCVSTSHDDPFQCNEYLGSDVDLVPNPCDAVFGAQYCIKHTGRFEAMGADCYQCLSSKNVDCTDSMIHDGNISATTCDHVFEARYCIKTVGLYGGGLGTKRFCSSLDLGNYCNYIKQPGDQLEYRSCVFTCSTDGCNLAGSKRPHHLVILLSVALLTIIAVS